MVIHDASACADHRHSRCVDTVTLPLPPAAGSSWLLFVTPISHLVADGPMTLVLADPPHPPAA
jgi:hypothetical protein